MDAQENVVVEEEFKVPCQVWSRIVGYVRPLQDWNPSKQHEFTQRVTYLVPQMEEPTLAEDGFDKI